jgi:UDP-N-acetylmuramate dehydrogenase
MISQHGKELLKLIDSKILIDEPLKKHTTFGIGGNSSMFVFPENKKDLKIVLKYAFKNNIEIVFIGSGSNLLISDNGFKGIIISLKKTFKNFNINDQLEAEIETGVMLGNIVKILTQKSVKGIESLMGVPGTLGGAIMMNAGAYGSEISNFLTEINVIDYRGNEKIYKKDDINFSYRFSSIRNTEIITQAKFKFIKGNLDNIAIRKRNISNKRKSNQPLTYRSAGSIFKNPNKEIAAGYLIDQAKLKGKRIGDAEISTKHANFIINHGNASSSDIINLIKIIKNKVKEKFNIELNLEIKLIGFFKHELIGVA